MPAAYISELSASDLTSHEILLALQLQERALAIVLESCRYRPALSVRQKYRVNAFLGFRFRSDTS